MRRAVFSMSVLLAILAFAAGAAGSSAGGPRSTASLDLYTGVVSSETLGRLVRQGYDIADARPAAGGVRVDLVLTKAEVAKLGAQGVDVQPRRDAQGRTQAQRAAAQAAGGFNVWRSYDEPGGIRDELYSIARRNPQIVKLEVIGHTLQGREIIALKVTKNAKTVADGARPDVLYMSTIHAREWISTEVNRRLLHYFVDNYGKNADVTNLVNTRELWFLVVANPDGYQYTFDHERLWRKNLHDNDGDGQITGNDGVDLNRNYDVDWGYDNEGSSTQFSADDYRGTGPASEPETQAHQALIDRLKFKFLITYHSYGPLILYPFGWQVQTPSADDPLFVAYSGIDATPAISGFDPGVGADLYITNGTTDDYSYAKTGALSWTVELNEGCDGCGFVFPDDESLVQGEYEKNLPFALDLAKSAANPGQPVSHLGNTVKPFYLDMGKDGKAPDGPDPEKTNNPAVDFTFSVSYGDPQPVRVLAKRDLNGDGTADAVTLNYQITRNGVAQAVQTAPTSQWNGGERGRGRRLLLPRHAGRRDRDATRRLGEGVVHGRRPDERLVHVRREGRVGEPRARAGRGGLHRAVAGVQVEPAARVPLVLPRRAGRDRLRRRRVRRRRERPRGAERARRALPLQGGDLVHGRRRHHPRAGDGAGHRVAPRQRRAARRARVPQRGRPAALHGQVRGAGVRPGVRVQPRDERAVRPGQRGGRLPGPVRRLPAVLPRRVHLQRGRGHDREGDALRRDGRGRPVQRAGLVVRLSERQQPGPLRLVHHDERHPAESAVPAVRQLGGREVRAPRRAVRPAHGLVLRVLEHRGHQLQAPDADDQRSRRAAATSRSGSRATPSPTGTSCSSRPTPWARTTGRRCPTRTGTRARARARTTRTWRAARPAGATCTRGSTTTRRSNPDSSCSPTGTTGVWNAASGRSQGWEQWSINLGAYAGKQVEVSIAYASDWSFQGLGTFVDDITLPDRRVDVVRDRPRRLDGDRARRRAAPRTRTTSRGRPPAASPRAPSWPRPTRSTRASGSRGSPRPPRGTR